jgi:methylmalonyl-CoA/ethylmalonyl-CoA epimerase
MKPPVVDLFGPTAVLHHIGLAVRGIDLTGLADLEVTLDPVQQVRVAFVTIGDTVIEILEPAGDDTPITQSLEKGVKLLHLCFEVDDIYRAMQVADSRGCKVIRPPVPAEAFGGRFIAWVYHPLWGLFELLSKK